MCRRFAILLVVCAAGCLWRSYGTIMEVHLDVLTQTADKLCSVVESGRGPTAEGMAEYVYPAQRARQFLRQFNGYSQRRSYHQFGALLDRYEALVREVDAARTQGRLGPEVRTRLKGESDLLRATAAAIRTDLKAGD
ncbi:MAG TPA: hypothetical protein VMW56_10225 [Candidatus Margulisiibacteriota bacterium]|nr:hypothetical protein [Candidatus Margulisiibacteriota bacterium]